MRWLYTLSLIILCALCQSCIFGDSKKNHGSSNDRGQRPLPGQSGDGTSITLPIEAENKSVSLIFEMNADNTVLTVRSETPNEKLFVSSSLTGTVFTNEDKHVGVMSNDLGNGVSLNFDLGQNSLVQQGNGQSIQSGDQIAETRDTVRFYIENQGQKVPFCVNEHNIVNRAPEHVILKVSKPERPCQ